LRDHDLLDKMVKIVVTDDQGRYVLRSLPKKNHNWWVASTDWSITKVIDCARQDRQPQPRWRRRAQLHERALLLTAVY